MARSTRTSNPVTLFPFLAVLLCTIGALVLMLVVVSAGIRKDAVATATAKQKSKADAATAQPVRMEAGATVAPENRIVEIVEEADSRQRPIEPLFGREPLPSPIKEASPQTLTEIAELERVARHLQAEVADRSARFQNVSVKANALQDDLQQAIIRTANQRAKLEQSAGELRVENQQIIEWLDESRKLISEHSKQLLSPVHSIVPYDGQTGTVRRPIIIECVDDVVRFEAEQVEIPVAVLRKFSPEQNPLLSGVQALFGYWMAKEQIADPGRRPGKPYALILVRPSGAEAFSSAVFALDEIIGDFGYELVEAEFQYELPETTPDAVRECRAAVESELRRGPVRSRRVLNPQGPVDISRVARGPAASRGFFSSDDFRNRAAVSSADDAEGLFGRSSSGSGGQEAGSSGTPSPDRALHTEKVDEQAITERARQLLKGRVAQGNSLLQKQRPEGLDAARAAKLAELATAEAGLKSGEEAGERQRGSTGSMSEEAAAGPPRWLADSEGRPILRDGSPGSGREQSGQRGERQTPKSGTGDERGLSGGGSGFENGGDRSGGQSSSGDRTAPGSGAAPQPLSGSRTPDATSADGTSQTPFTDREISAVGRPATTGQPNGSQADASSGSSSSSASTNSASTASSGSDASQVSTNGPPIPMLSRSNAIRSLKAQRRWGLSHPDASLGLEKVVVITIETGRVVIGNQFQVTRRSELTAAEVAGRTVLALEEIAKNWGWPPPRFYWVPSVKLEFEPTEQQLGTLIEAALEAAGAAME
jgi:hypothetical protein